MRIWPFNKKPKASYPEYLEPPAEDEMKMNHPSDFSTLIKAESIPDPSPIEYSGPLEASDSSSCDCGSSDGGCGGGD